MTNTTDPFITSMMHSIEQSAFWVMLCFAFVILWLSIQGYWTNWAHRRLDSMNQRMDRLEKDQADLKKDLDEIRSKNPLTWMRKVNL